MRIVSIYILGGLLIMAGLTACEYEGDKKVPEGAIIYKGMFSLGPNYKTFKACGSTYEYWVAASPDLELKYWEIIPHETPESPVYVEVEGVVAKSSPGDDGAIGDAKGFDSTLVVKKILKIAKNIPADCR